MPLQVITPPHPQALRSHRFAGRITAKETFRSPGREFLNSPVHGPRSSGHYSSTDPRFAPEDVLFRQKNAPVRYAERDVYWASDNLPEGHLPDSDLLKAVHAYASRFYEAMADTFADPDSSPASTQGSPPGSPSWALNDERIDERSMDETALLAFGILLEEASRDALGKRGDVVFTEAAEPGAGNIDDRPPKRRKVAKDDYVEEEP